MNAPMTPAQAYKKAYAYLRSYVERGSGPMALDDVETMLRAFVTDDSILQALENATLSWLERETKDKYEVKFSVWAVKQNFRRKNGKIQETYRKIYAHRYDEDVMPF